MTTTYLNPWDVGPEFYTTDVRPTEYRGYLIYHRLPKCWDVVRNGVCVDQRAGFKGAKAAIDRRVDPSEEWMRP